VKLTSISVEVCVGVPFLDVIETIKTGRSVRKFKPDPVGDKKLKEVLRLSDEPLHGLTANAGSFIIVKDKETKRSWLKLWRRETPDTPPRKELKEFVHYAKCGQKPQTSPET
jgi:hypothetical protein